MIAVVNIGVGNIKSVLSALRFVAPLQKIEMVSTASGLDSAERVIFPGQGSMKNCFSAFCSLGLLESFKNCLKKKPFLGICLGKQFLFDYSEEGSSPGLGLIAGSVIKFPSNYTKLKVPHMGWNSVAFRSNHPVFREFNQIEAKTTYFYFVHSFFVNPADREIIIGETEHGVRFPSVISKDNILATQFHPEKSASAGLMILKNFVSWNP